jgi:hypothetical protein
MNLDETNSGAAVFSARMAVRATIPGFLGATEVSRSNLRCSCK